MEGCREPPREGVSVPDARIGNLRNLLEWCGLKEWVALREPIAFHQSAQQWTVWTLGGLGADGRPTGTYLFHRHPTSRRLAASLFTVALLAATLKLLSDSVPLFGHVGRGSRLRMGCTFFRTSSCFAGLKGLFSLPSLRPGELIIRWSQVQILAGPAMFPRSCDASTSGSPCSGCVWIAETCWHPSSQWRRFAKTAEIGTQFPTVSCKRSSSTSSGKIKAHRTSSRSERPHKPAAEAVG
jgi:hypothetical protein